MDSEPHEQNGDQGRLPEGLSESMIESSTAAEPDYLRRARNVRAAFDLLFPMVVAFVVVGVFILLALRPELRDATFLGVIGTALVALAGFGLKQRGP
jgi:hypothetical protein